MSTRPRIMSRRRAFLAKAALFAQQGAAVAGAMTIDGQAVAKATNANLTVNATISPACVLKAAAVTMNFGAFGVFSPASTPSALVMETAGGSAALPYLCSNGSSANIEVNTNSVTLTGASNAAHTLLVTLYADVGDTTVFPTISPGVAVTGTGLSTSAMIYGRIVAAPSDRVDTYSGSAILTINY